MSKNQTLYNNNVLLDEILSNMIFDGGSGDSYDVYSDNILYYSDSTKIEIRECDFCGLEFCDVNFPNVKTISASAFQSCAALKNINAPEVTTIGDGAFSDCYELARVNFPKVVDIGSAAFLYCNTLTNMNFPEVITAKNMGGSNVINISMPKLTSLNFSQPFYSAKKLTNIYLPNLTTTNSWAFYSTCLTNVNVPKLSAINYYDFYGCSVLTHVVAPKAKSIGSQAFGGCYELVSVNFPNVDIVEQSAFAGCRSLTEVELPKVTNIKSNAFYSCSSLLKLNLLGSKICSLVNSSAFYSTPLASSIYGGYYGSIYVPDYLLSSYKNMTNWAYYSKRFVGVVAPYIISIDDKILLFNSTDTTSLSLAYMDYSPDVTITSSDESIVSISNIITTPTSINCNLNSHEKEGSVEINIAATYNGKTYVETFNVNVYEIMPTLYSVEDVSGSKYGFVLNTNGYYESNNKNKNSSYALCKVNIIASQDCTMYVDYINYAEGGCDYGIFSNLDKTLTNTTSDSDTTTIKQSLNNSTYNKQNVQTISYDVPEGKHFIYVKFRKDSSSSINNDSLQFKIRFE